MSAQRQPVADRPKPAPMVTSDLGLAIRDHIEDHSFEHFDGDQGTGRIAHVEFVDASDPSNLVVHCDTGEVFTIRILRTG